MATKKSSSGKKESPEATAPQAADMPTEKVAASDEKADETKSQQDPKPAPAPPAPKGPSVPFKRWFQAKGFKPHWRGGMEAFTDTSVRRTMEEWDRIFKDY